ncbi:HEAT repeat domain-containing protein [Paenibacillus sp. KQZ6P-2]|uniref:HEAT repeat domain-containing protein n=1 Tax=Paenibacillus mangrovi TaxID=2931978 RepID=A0A9X2B512_9BACL|nr:HEAT repeat domain-containing protein [Paenibacillus mangrovi]MCJ8011538.1 HEAT repeat domain-containing protein [Paenibacillus mangrovi]
MLDVKHLLSDEQIVQFITKGYVVLQNEVPQELHQEVLNKINYVMHSEGNPGNNILPRVPEIEQFFETPVVKGALTSVLGPDYHMHPHRHCHYNQPGNPVPGGGNWHKDGYWSSMRSHRPWWAMIFYYIQDITEEMGPTAIMPGTQYYEKFLGDKGETLLPTGKAGTMVLVHFDLWHKASINSSTLDRYMLKFQFVRLSTPKYPTWNHSNANYVIPQDVPVQHEDLWLDVWHWLLGQEPRSVVNLVAEDSRIQELGRLLQDEEVSALNAAYGLSTMGYKGADELLKHLQEGTNLVSTRAAYGLQGSGTAAVPGLIKALGHPEENRRALAAFVLGMLGCNASDAVPTLIAATKDGSEWVRRNAIEALGMMVQPADLIVPALAEALETSLEDETVAAAVPTDQYASNQKYIINKIGYTACLSLLRAGREGDPAIVLHALKKALSSKDRYVRAYAFEALGHLRTEEAIEVIIQYFRSARWCPDTHKASSF